MTVSYAQETQENSKGWVAKVSWKAPKGKKRKRELIRGCNLFSGTFLQPAEDHHCFLARAIWDMLLTVAIPTNDDKKFGNETKSTRIVVFYEMSNIDLIYER